jgi:toxin-antitoxin system PIN domain toxin
MTAACLLDVNILIAMTWPSHEAHTKVQHWLSGRGREKWASCPFTQTAFVRLLSNPAFSPNALTPANALALLESNLGHPGHQFWHDDIGLTEAMALVQPKIVGHQQVTDAYLLGLTIHKKGRLATLDRKVPALLPEKGAARDLIILI